MGLKTRKAAEEAAKQQVNAEANAKKHLLVKMGADRNVREAYLYGIVFAGLANDDEEPEIQSEERSILNEICESLEIEVALVEKIIVAEKSSIDDDTYMDLLRECVSVFDDIKVFDVFLRDFDKVWAAGKGKSSELKSWHNDFEEMVSTVVAKVLAGRKADEEKTAAEEKAKLAAAEKIRQEKLKVERQKMAVEGQYKRLQDFVQDWISTKRVTQDILITAKERLRAGLTSVDVQTVFHETCKQLIERVVELDREGEKLEDGGIFGKKRPAKDKAIAEKIALETTWIVICLVLLKCKVADLKIKTVNELLEHARFEDFAGESSLSFFWRDPNGLGDYRPRVEDFFVKATGLERAWDEVADELLSMTESQKQRMHEWRSERKRFKLEDEAAFASSIGVNRFILRHTQESWLMESRR